MGLFDGLKKKAPEPAAPETKHVIMSVNLSNRAARTDIDKGEDGTLFRNCHLWKDGNKIRCFEGGKLIFEVTEKSKAFQELDPWTGRDLNYVSMKMREGDYGMYYRVTISADIPEDDIVYSG